MVDMSASTSEVGGFFPAGDWSTTGSRTLGFDEPAEEVILQRNCLGRTVSCPLRLLVWRRMAFRVVRVRVYLDRVRGRSHHVVFRPLLFLSFFRFSLAG